MEIYTIKQIVEDILAEDSKARNNDTWLVIQVLRKIGFKVFIDYRNLEDLPSFETIIRCRRFIQNKEGRFIPREDIDGLRNKREGEYRNIWKNSHLT